MAELYLTVSAHLVIPLSEMQFRTSRSGGPGGQNVNKLETRVELLFDILHSPSISEDVRRLLVDRLGVRIDGEGILRIVSQESRSQFQNKQRALEKLADLLKLALKPRKHRKNTKPTKGSRERRIESKKRVGEKKRLRNFGHEQI